LPDKVFPIDKNAEFLKGLDFLIIDMPQTDTNDGINRETYESEFHEGICINTIKLNTSLKK
tara:strand:- start:11247 stop:11429 length:183 start_codon:yes stop_codon:yes gene_type:complete